MIPNNDWATYLVALSDGHVTALSKSSINHLRPSGAAIPRKLNTNRKLNFCSQDNPLWHYDAFLYSAGCAETNLAKAAKTGASIYSRDRTQTYLFGDSGGYQRAMGKLPVAYHDKRARERVFLKLLEWQEATCDAAAILDDPAWVPGSKFETCLNQTTLAIDFWIANMSKTVPMLNVCHGNDEEQMNEWFTAVNRPGIFQGWAFGGLLRGNAYLLLLAIVLLWESGELANAKLLHFFGGSASNLAILLSHIQHRLRHLNGINSDIQITFDTSNPTADMANNVWLTNIREAKSGNSPIVPERIGISTLAISKASDATFDTDFGKMSFPGSCQSNASPFLKDLTLGELIVPTRSGLGFDQLSAAIITANNAYWAVESVTHSNRQAEILRLIPAAKRTLLTRQWRLVMEVLDIVDRVFDETDPVCARVIIRNYRHVLTSYL